MDELLKLLTAANRAHQAGIDISAIDKAIQNRTNQRFSSLRELGAHLKQNRKAPAATGEDAALQRVNERGGNAVTDFLRMAGQGASFGFGDEIAGAAAAVVPGGQGYTEARDASRQRLEDTRQLNPGASAASEIAGGLALPFAGGAKVTRALTRPGAGIPARMLAGAGGGAAAGAGGGALYGAGEAQGGLLDRVGGAARGGAVGGVAGGLLGGALPVAGATLGAIGRFGRDITAPNAGGRAGASRTVRRAVDEAGIDPQTVPARLDELGPDAVIADLDPSLARTARAARNQAPALDRAGGPVSRLGARQDTRGDRLAQAMLDAADDPPTMEGARKAAEAAVEDVREQFYRPLERQFQQVDGPNVSQALQDGRISKVAKKIMGEEPAPAPAVDYRGMHGAPLRSSADEGVSAPLHDLTRVYPDDVYGKDAARFYGHGGSDVAIDRETAGLLRQLRGDPSREVTVYRAVPKGAPDDINPGDWVTINRRYAQGHGEGPLRGDYKIISKEVRADDIWSDGNSIHEFGFDPPQGAASGGRAPSFTELQDIMMELRDDVTAARAAGRPNASRKANEAFQKLIGAMEQDIPGFRQAQGAFMRASKAVQALDDGYKVAQKSAREIREAMEELPESAHDAFRIGALQRWREKLLQREGGGGTAGRLVSPGEDAKEALRILFGSEEGYGRFMRAKGLEDVYGTTWNQIAGNSTTAMQANDAIDLAGEVSKGGVWRRIMESLLDTGEARKIEAQRVGETLLGRDVGALQEMLRPGLLDIPGAGGGVGGTVGALSGGPARGLLN